MSTEFHFRMVKIVMRGGSDGCTTGMYLMPLNCILNNHEDDAFYVMCISPQLKKKSSDPVIHLKVNIFKNS